MSPPTRRTYRFLGMIRKEKASKNSDIMHDIEIFAIDIGMKSKNYFTYGYWCKIDPILEYLNSCSWAMLSPVWSPYSKIPSQSPLLLLLWTQDPTTLAEMRALGFQFRAGDAGVHFVATPLGTQLSIAKLYTWLARKSPKWRFLAVKIIERHEGVFFPQAMCVCVKRLHRRKTSVVTHRIIYYIIPTPLT